MSFNAIKRTFSFLLIILPLNSKGQERDLFPKMPVLMNAKCHCIDSSQSSKNSDKNKNYFYLSFFLSKKETTINNKNYYKYSLDYAKSRIDELRDSNKRIDEVIEYHKPTQDYLRLGSNFKNIEGDHTIFFLNNIGGMDDCGDYLKSKFKKDSVNWDGDKFRIFAEWGKHNARRPICIRFSSLFLFPYEGAISSGFFPFDKHLIWYDGFEEVEMEWGTDSIFQYKMTKLKRTDNPVDKRKERPGYIGEIQELVLSKKRGLIKVKLKREGLLYNCRFQDKGNGNE